MTEKVLIIGGVLILAYGALLGYPITLGALAQTTAIGIFGVGVLEAA